MWWWLFACAGSEPVAPPVAFSVGPVTLPVVKHASRAAPGDYAAFSDPLHVPSSAELAKCIAGEPVEHAWAVLELTSGDPRLSGRPIPLEGLGEALFTMADTTRAVSAEGCGQPGGRLLIVADAGHSYAAVMQAMYSAGRSGFTAFDVLVEDKTPGDPVVVGPGRAETLLLRASGASLSRVEVAPGGLAAALGRGPIDLTLAASEDVPLRDVLEAHDVVAGIGGRVVWGLGDGVVPGPSVAGNAPIEWKLVEQVPVLRLHVPVAGDGWALPPGEGL